MDAGPSPARRFLTLPVLAAALTLVAMVAAVGLWAGRAAAGPDDPGKTAAFWVGADATVTLRVYHAVDNRWETFSVAPGQDAVLSFTPSPPDTEDTYDGSFSVPQTVSDLDGNCFSLDSWSAPQEPGINVVGNTVFLQGVSFDSLDIQNFTANYVLC